MLAVFAVAGGDGKSGQAANEVYIRAVTAVLADASRPVAAQAVAEIVKTHQYGKLPKPGDVSAKIAEIQAPISNARAVAWMHLREHERRAEKRRLRSEEDARVEADRAKVQAGFAALLGRIGEASNG